jgi:hypothetical protein
MDNPNRKFMQLLAALILAAAIAALPASGAHPSPQSSASTASAADKSFIVEYYYKVKWGHADEFVALFKKNHYPVLKKEIELGRMLRVSAVTPRYHSTEEGRWDYRITIVYKNAAIAHDDFDSASFLKQLFPDQETYKREEQRRFEILDAHWDIPLKDMDLDAR